MFTWFVSLLLLLGYNGRAVSVSTPSLNGSGNAHKIPADNPQPDGSEPADTDGQGSGSSGGPKG